MIDISYVRDLCADFLGGKWDKQRDEIHIETIRRGFALKTYRCSVKDGDKREYVMVKIFNGEETKKYSRYAFQGIVGEMVVFSLLSTVGIAPKLFAAFDNGRIEEYIKGRNLENDDFHNDPSLYSAVAKLLVKFHSQSMPITKRINYFGKLINEINAASQYCVEEFYEEHRVHFKRIQEFPVEDELEWIINKLSKINSKIVFSHNNLYPGNLILREKFSSDNDCLVLIDYEVAGYNFRGYDLAFLLNNSQYRYAEIDGKIVIEFEGETKPETERLFLEEYLRELSHFEHLNNDLDTIDHLIMECKFFSLLAQLSLVCFAKGLINKPIWCHQFASFVRLPYFTNKILILSVINDLCRRIITSNIFTLWSDNYKSKKDIFCETYADIIE